MNRIRASILTSTVVALALLTGCQNDNTVTPPMIRLVSVTPDSVSRGAQLVTLEIAGTALSSVTSVDFGADVTVVSKETKDDQHMDVVVNIAASAQPGPRTLTASGSGGTAQLAGAITIRKNPAPLIVFSISPDPGSVNIPSVFDASLTTDNGSIVSYKWEFSDGGSRNGVKAKYQFDTAGTYTVRLTVTDNLGGVTSAERQLDVLENLPPVASFVVTPSAGSQFTTFTFDATSSSDPDGTIQKYHWDLGDGFISNKPIVEHRYGVAGKFKVQLTVTDDRGTTGTKQETFKVKEFDVQEAEREINDVTKEFLTLFGQIETLSAEQIVVGFSTNPACPGRQHEINIINSEKPFIKTSGVQILGNAIVSDLTELKAKADLTARFYGEHTDGSTYDGVHTHHFDMVNEGGNWKICDFTLD